MLVSLWTWLKMAMGVANTADFINLAIRKLVTPDVQAQLTALILEVANEKLTGSEKKVLVLQRFEEIKKTVLANVTNLRAEAVSTAIDLIVGYLRLKAMIPYSTEFNYSSGQKE